ncbi:MAG: polysaccharide biosynthesis tyrosine autokinase, partial [Desulfobaccales bacterium]
IPPMHRYQRSLHDYLGILLRRRWAFLAVFIGIVATSAIYSFTATPFYKATVQLLIERQAPRLLEQEPGRSEYSYNEEFYQTQYKLLESRALAKKVVDKLQLKNNPVYAGIFQKLPANADEALKQGAEESLVGAIAGGIKVTPIKDSSLVDVSFSDPDPKFAAQVVNTFAHCFIQQSLDLKFAASQEGADWLQQKLTEARKKLEDSEAKLNEYKKEQNIVTTEDKETLTAQNLGQLSKDMLTAQTQRMEAETRFQEVSQGRPIPQVLNNPLIQTLKAQEAKLIAEQSELSRKFGESHPRMIQINNELAATRGKIGAEMSQIVQAIKNEYQMAKAQEENLKAALNAQKQDTQDMSDRSIKYRVLLRDVETNRALYENVMKSLKTVTTTENMPATNIRIVYPATVPEAPDFPRKTRNMLIALALGVVGGIGLALGLENLDTTLKTPEEVEGWLEIPNLAMIPHLGVSASNPVQESPELIVHHGSQPQASESYLGLRTSILFSTPDHPPRILLVTSSMPLEGKTMTAANLATALAKAEPPVLLVDCDLRRPSLHTLFQVPLEPGLSNFLVGDVNELPLVETLVPDLLVMPAGKIPPNPSELLHSDRMQKLFALALEKFGRVVVDSPPLMSVTDSAILATMVEGVLLVVKAEGAPRKAVIQARNVLAEVKAPLLGAVLNNIPMGGKYGYYYSQYYRYHSYYASDSGNGKPPTPRRRRHQPKTGPLGWVKDRVNTFRQKI